MHAFFEVAKPFRQADGEREAVCDPDRQLVTSQQNMSAGSGGDVQFHEDERHPECGELPARGAVSGEDFDLGSSALSPRLLIDVA